MLAVTTQPAVRERLKEVSAALGLALLGFSDSIEEALESGIDSPVLFLDLGSCSRDRSLQHALHTWEAFRPGSEVLLFAPLIDQESELRAAVTLTRATRFVETRLVTSQEFYREDHWRKLRVVAERAALEAELRSELLDAVRQRGRKVRAEAVVLQVLHHATRREGDSTHAEDRNTLRENQRKLLWKLLRRGGQFSASRLLLVFRVLWYVKLRERGWSAGQIAHFLGFTSARHFRLTMKTRLRFSMAQLKELRYDEVLRWAALSISSAREDRERTDVPWRILSNSLVELLQNS